jgi:hypothetical protein
MDLNDRIRRGKGAKAQTALGMLGPTHDFQLRRVLLKLGPDVIVTGTRQGRSVVYSLYDNLGDRPHRGRLTVLALPAAGRESGNPSAALAKVRPFDIANW